MENKEKFIDKLSDILIMYSREAIRELKYIKKDLREYTEITYINGDKTYIDITGDSCIAIMSDIYKAMR